MITYFHGPIDYANTLKLRFRVGTSTCQKSQTGMSVVWWGRKKVHKAALVAT